ncbi:MAG: GntG family PLP-dependent aldolase [Candidatus Zixiibacteriota bacterium]
MKFIDLRSDTVTRPSPEMRQALANAEVGDDVFNDDPTVIRLEKMTAELLGKEAGLFVPTGTMGNQVAIKTLSSPGDEIICDEGCHVFNYEVGAGAVISGLMFHVIRGVRGIITAADIAPLIRLGDAHSPRTAIIEIENTHNRAGGTVIPIEVMQGIRQLADEQRIMVHLDGARLWNAHISTGIPLADYAQCADTISVCYSKGLGAPIGSCIVGDREIILAARGVRKMFGGGMRQVGVLAAAAIYAVENNIPRLVEDHENAWYLAESLSEIEGIYIDLDSVQTNIVVMDIAGAGREVPDVIYALKEKGVLAVQFGRTKVRCVTHLDVNREDIRDAIKIFKEVFDS